MDEVFAVASQYGRVIGEIAGEGRFVAIPVCTSTGFSRTVLVDRGISPIKTDKTDVALTMGAAVRCDSRLNELIRSRDLAVGDALIAQQNLRRAQRQLGTARAETARERANNAHLRHDLGKAEAGKKPATRKTTRRR